MCGQVGFNNVEACIRKVILNEDIKDLTYKKGVILRYFNEVLIPHDCIDEITKVKSIQNPISEINKHL